MKIEGSLAHKWGVETSVLEASHPYYAYNPYGGAQVDYPEGSCRKIWQKYQLWNKNGE